MSQPHASSEIIWQRVLSLCMSRSIGSSQLAKEAGVSRATLHNLATGATAAPRIETLQRIAAVLQVEVEELCGAASMIDLAKNATFSDDDAKRDFDRRTNGFVRDVFRSSPESFANWSVQDWDELYSAFGVGGELSEEGAILAVEQINRKRETTRKLAVVLETHLGKHAEEMIDSLYRMVSITSDNLETSDQFQGLIDRANGGQQSGG